MSSIDSVLSSFPRHIRADIIYEMKKLSEKSEELSEYTAFVIENRKNPKKILFYPKLFQPELRSINGQIFHLKHDRVSRKGMKCPHCGSTNTKARFVQNRSGDEMSSTIIYCNNCKRTTTF